MFIQIIYIFLLANYLYCCSSHNNGIDDTKKAHAVQGAP